MKFKRLFPLFFMCILLTGCWDKDEIDRKIFVSTIGIDVGEDIDNDKDAKKLKPSDPFQQRMETKKLKVTYAFPDITELGPGKPGTAKNQFISTDASSMEDAVTMATGKSSRSISYGHTKLVMISAALLEHPDAFKEILDYLGRNPKLNKMMYVVVTEGGTEDYIKFNPPMEKNIEAYLTGLMDSSEKNSSILPVTLNEIIILLDKNSNCIIPKVTIDKSKNELNLSGIAVIKNFALKGFLTPVEVGDLELLRGKLKGGMKVIYIDGHPIDYSIEGIDRKIKVYNDKDKLQVSINIRLEGQLKEFYYGKEVFSKEELATIEESFNKSLSQECEIIAKMLQTEFSVDTIGISDYIEKYDPKLWNKIKDKWEDTYKNASIKVNVDTKVRRIGVTK